VTPGQVGDMRVAQALVASVPPPTALDADAAYDSECFHGFLLERRTKAIIPNNPTRKRGHSFDERGHRAGNPIERMFCRLKDWRHIATRYDKLATTFLSGIFLATVLIWRT
jgi:transposase